MFAFSGAAILSALREYEMGFFKAREFSHKNSQGDYDQILGIIQTAWDDDVQSPHCHDLCNTLKQLVLVLTDGPD